MNNASRPRPIGVFDSGVGGLSVLRAIWQELPNQPIIYLADQAHVPYGSRSLHQVRDFSYEITRFLLNLDAKLIVVACNTASAAALKYLRNAFPETPFVGMEPAVKPAAQYTKSGVVGVLATPATFQGQLYTSVVERYAANIEIIQDTCPGLVAQIEAGKLEGDITEAILRNALSPMLQAQTDTIVLGCTHYPFVIPLIKSLVGENIQVIDPAPAVARQVRRLLESQGILEMENLAPENNLPDSSIADFITTGSPEAFKSLVSQLLSIDPPVQVAHWRGKNLVMQPG